ncbi:MAG: hypothetical protein WBF77_04175 [Sulfurimonadaceae bacterium]
MRKIKQLFTWIKQQRKSFLAYIFGTIIYLLGLGTSIQEGYSYTELIAVSLFIFGIILDSLNILKTLHGTVYEKLLYLVFAIITFFTYVQAESFAKQAVYATVQANPDLFSTSVAHLAGIYFIPSFMLMLAQFLVFALLIATLLFSLLPILDSIKKTIDFRKDAVHIGFYFIGFSVAIFGFFDLDSDKLQEKILGKNYVPVHILAKDYYINNTCKQIPKVYIKHLEENLVSVTNVTNFNYPLLFGSSIDQNITFKLMECEQKIGKGTL